MPADTKRRREVHALPADREHDAPGARLRAERRRRHWDKPEMARRLGRALTGSHPSITTLISYVKRWESGKVDVSERYRLAYAAAFDTNVDELFGREEPSGDLVYAGSAEVIAPRRHSGPVAPELADYFRDQLAGHYTADRHLGSLRLIPTAVTQYQLLCELANAADGRLRHTMWALAAGYSAFIGWLYQDGGDVDRSVYWHDVMIERAHRSLDPQLVGFALHNKAMLHADMLDGPGVVDLARAALVHESILTPKVRVLALQQTAHGTSLVGGDDARDECDRLLDDAAGLLDRIDDPYPWGSACLTPHYLDVQRATCYGRLGLADEALTVWGRVLPAMAAGARRDVGVFRARQAQVLAMRGEPEQAVQIAGEVVTLAEETGSARMARELQALETHMRPWAKEAPGRELGLMLASMGGTT